MAGSKPGDDGLADGGLEDSDEFLGRDSGLSQDAAERTDGNDAVCRHTQPIEPSNVALFMMT